MKVTFTGNAFRLLLPALFSLLGCGPGLAQSGFPGRSVQGEVEAGGLVSTDRATPFWLRTNLYGIVPLESPIVTLRASLRREYGRLDTTRAARRFDWGFVVNPVVNAGRENGLLLPEAFVKVKYGMIELFGGRRREVIGLGDTTLTSGFLIGSGNALPIPKIQIGTRGYASLPFLGRFVAVSASFGHAWFNVPYIRGAYLHQKHLYLRFGKPRSRLKVHAGINHQVQWGGEAEYLKGPAGLSANGKLPSSLKDYGFIISAIVPGNWAERGYISFDSYKIGNHLGSYDFGLEFNTRQGNLMLYHQHPYEDVSSLLFMNFPDGLWGFSWANVPPLTRSPAFRLERLTLEYLMTVDQTASTFYVPGSSYQGADNYFNHGQYKEGWSYRNRSIGTPFLAPITNYRPEVQAQSGGFFPNNRVRMWYAGARGLVKNRVGLTLRASYSQNFGTIPVPYAAAIGQFSALAGAEIPLSRWPNTVLTTSLAVDGKGMFPAAAGGFFSVRKRW
ncbi:capsule assembly Wzi family protein [Tellurirhabdus rosea]|uniref:capsule assembly Wzi family protein n=1 Tax=Tellurirhabdus rosea TaxID=2674997 RepID=UPI002258A268|nr:capsule assembly Wzi family protein [Tellurirhabdus rosea]